MRLALAIALAVAVGCRVVRVEKHDPVVFSDPVTQEVTVLPGGWDLSIHSFLVFTSIGDLDVDVRTNGVVAFRLCDLRSSSDTNAVRAVADAAAKAVVEALPFVFLATNSVPDEAVTPI